MYVGEGGGEGVGGFWGRGVERLVFIVCGRIGGIMVYVVCGRRGGRMRSEVCGRGGESRVRRERCK